MEEPQCQPDEDICRDLHRRRHEAANIAVAMKLGGVEGQAVIPGPDGEPARSNSKARMFGKRRKGLFKNPREEIFCLVDESDSFSS